MGEKRGLYSVLMRKPEEKRPIGRSRRRRKDDIHIHLQDVDCGAWTRLSWPKIETGGGRL